MGQCITLHAWLQVELTDREFEKLLAEEEKQKMDGKRKKKPMRRETRGPRSRILNRHRRSKARMNESKSDDSGDEVKFAAVVVNSYVTDVLREFGAIIII